MNNNKRRRVLMIGLDAAEPALLEKWMAAGQLPHIERLHRQGVYGRLASSAKWLAGSPWPTFYTSTTPAEHGLYHYLHWRAEEMNLARPTPDWLPLQPFWESFGPEDPRVVAIDVPTTYTPRPFHGAAISGYTTHDRPGPPSAYPADLIKWVRREFGPSPIKPEVYGRQPVSSLLKLRDRLNKATATVADLALALMARQEWGFFITVFGATHSGGHKLWDHTGTADAGDADYALFDQALGDVYEACDQAVGRLVDAAGEDTTVLLFSVHGMGANSSRVELLPEMLDRILHDDQGQEAAAADDSGDQKPGFLSRLRMAVPLEWRSTVKSRLPTALQDRLTAFWLLRNVDWSQIRAFAMAGADLQGYIRFNLAGREAAGIVSPAETEQLAADISAGLLTFADAATGQPVVAEVKRPSEIFPPGRRLAEMPDLIVRWHDSPLAGQRAIVSPRYGSIRRSAPGYNPNGRSGNHQPEGFLLAAGPGLAPGDLPAAADIIDLAPTVCALLGIPIPAAMCGRPLLPPPN